MKPGERKTKPGKRAGKARKRRGTRGVLWVIALMLGLSGVLRFGGTTGLAIASGVATALDQPAGAPTGDCAAPPDVAEVLDLLAVREARLDEREAALADRMQALTVAEAQISKNMAALQAAESSLKETIALSATAAEDDLARLTSVYENMKPKEAAPLFAEMAPEFAAGFLGRMRPDAAAAIMAKLEPQTAYSISVLLAGRNALVPTE